MAIKSFANQGTEDIFYAVNSDKARKQCDKKVWKKAYTLLHLLHNAEKLTELKQTPGMRLEPLKYSKPGYHSIRVNNQYRIIFEWVNRQQKTKEGETLGDAYNVSVEDPKHHQP